MKTTREILLKNLGYYIAEIDNLLLHLIELSMLEMANSALFEVENVGIDTFSSNCIFVVRDKIYQEIKKIKDGRGSKKEIIFEDQGQDLMSMVIESKGIGVILEVKLKELEHLYKGSYINPESIVVGQKLEILNFKGRCSDFIKYPIREIKEIV